ncbi:MAG: hypothetical protein FJZ87_15030 [Chloroflexi bacterium]|nr:hypothetical protein [Chloroflexota bacterium]
MIFDYRVTALTKLLERIGYASTSWLFGRRFRTYDMYVEDEVQSALRTTSQFTRGTIPLPHVEVDRNLVTSRYWLFDAVRYSKDFADMVERRLR